MGLASTPDTAIEIGTFQSHLKERILELNDYLNNKEYVDRTSVKNTLNSSKALYVTLYKKIDFDISNDNTVLTPIAVTPTELGKGEFYAH